MYLFSTHILRDTIMQHKMGSKWIWMKSVEFELWRSHEILSRLFVCDRFKSLMNQNWCQRCSFTKMCHHPEWISSHSAIYIRVCHIFLDFKVSRYIEGYSFWSIWYLKVRIFWEGHKIWKYLPLKTWCYSLMSNFLVEDFFQIFWPTQNIRTLKATSNLVGCFVSKQL